MIGQSLILFGGEMTMFTDASLQGQGAHLDSATKWSQQWRSFAINGLELAFQPRVENSQSW